MIYVASIIVNEMDVFEKLRVERYSINVDTFIDTVNAALVQLGV